MNSKHGISLVIKNQTINGYPSEDNLCVINGNDGKNDIVVNIFVEPDGKLVIETDYLGDIDIRKSYRRNVSEGIPRIGGGCSSPSEEMILSCNINC